MKSGLKVFISPFMVSGVCRSSNHCRDEKRTERTSTRRRKGPVEGVATIAAMKSGLKDLTACYCAVGMQVATIAAMKSGLKAAMVLSVMHRNL